MPIINSFDKATIKMLRPEVLNALKDVGERFGLDFSLGNAEFDSSEVGIKLVMKVVNTESGKPAAQERFEHYCTMFGLTAEDYDRPFKLQGKTHVIVDINLKAQKNCLSIKDVATGKIYVCSPSTYKDAITLEEARSRKVA